ncbi:MAG: acyl-CoA thioesterase [Spirochaetes bacterium]|nr:acyl-CoA thioesterase [Spirochaetota bacterium]
MEQSQIRPMYLEKPLKVNAYDIDVMGIVSNIVYIRWFEDLRFYFLDHYWPYEEMMEKKQSPILAKTEANYHHPITIFDKPIGKIWVSEFSRVRWTMCLEISTADKIHCTGLQTGYVFSLEKKRPVPFPRDLLQQYKEAVEPLGMNKEQVEE